MFKALIFDMDGLMIDSESFYWQVEKDIARQHGKECPDAVLQNMMGRKPLESIAYYCDALALDISPDQILLHRDALVCELLKTVEPMPGLIEILHAFHPTLLLAIATSAERHMVDIVMERLQIEKYFHTIQTSNGISQGKPHPEIYLTTMQKLAVNPNECIVLEDSHNGARAGKAAGAYTIAVPSTYTASQDFSFADFRAKDLHQAREKIEQLIHAI